MNTVTIFLQGKFNWTSPLSKLLIFNIKHFVTNSFLLVRGGKTLSCRVTRASFANVAAMFKTFLPSFLPFCYQTIVWQGLLVLPFLEKTLEAVKGPFFEYRVSFRDPRQFCSPVTSSRKFPWGTATFIRSVKDFLVLILLLAVRSLTYPRLFIVLPISKRILLQRVLKGTSVLGKAQGRNLIRRQRARGRVES